MDLLSIIIFFVVIAKIFKKNDPKKYEETVRKAKTLGGEVVGELRGVMNEKRTNYEQQRRNYEQMNMQTYQKEQRVRPVQTTSSTQSSRTTQTTQVREENDAARQQIYKSRMEAKNTTILHRAKANAEEDKEDVTLRSLEETHGHSAHVAPAIHNHPEDEIPENSIEKIQDLMVKGYEGELCFERDFVGEAMDMVNRFSMGGSV